MSEALNIIKEDVEANGCDDLYITKITLAVEQSFLDKLKEVHQYIKSKGVSYRAIEISANEIELGMYEGDDKLIGENDDEYAFYRGDFVCRISSTSIKFIVYGKYDYDAHLTCDLFDEVIGEIV